MLAIGMLDNRDSYYLIKKKSISPEIEKQFYLYGAEEIILEVGKLFDRSKFTFPVAAHCVPLRKTS